MRYSLAGPDEFGFYTATGPGGDEIKHRYICGCGRTHYLTGVGKLVTDCCRAQFEWTGTYILLGPEEKKKP